MFMKKQIVMSWVMYITASLSCLNTQSRAQATLTSKSNLSPVIVTEASSKEFDADRDRLLDLSRAGNLNVFLSAADQISKKWMIKDKLSYYGVLSAVCSDLTSYNFGIKNLAKQREEVEKYAMDALTHDDSLGLGMRAFFTEQLTYAPGYGVSGPTGQDWSHLRGQRLLLWLGVWKQIQARTVNNFHGDLKEPKLPPSKYISSIFITNTINPNDITDIAERKKYAEALAKYLDNLRIAKDQDDLKWVTGTYLPLAVDNIITDYSSVPYNTSELQQSLSTSLLAPDVCDEILAAVKENIKRNAAVGK